MTMNKQEIKDLLEATRVKIADQGKERDCMVADELLNREYTLEQQLIDLDKSNNQQEQ
tara:strand:+ start:261 stop:434 length:174 start_codon:yes stop_codon:yes gene_type:complete